MDGLMASSRCTHCGGIGFVTIWRLVWKRRNCSQLVNCSRRVESQQEGLEELERLDVEADVDAQVLSGAVRCRCHPAPVRVDQILEAASPPATVMPVVERDEPMPWWLR